MGHIITSSACSIWWFGIQKFLLEEEEEEEHNTNHPHHIQRLIHTSSVWISWFGLKQRDKMGGVERHHHITWCVPPDLILSSPFLLFIEYSGSSPVTRLLQKCYFTFSIIRWSKDSDITSNIPKKMKETRRPGKKEGEGFQVRQQRQDWVYLMPEKEEEGRQRMKQKKSCIPVATTDRFSSSSLWSDHHWMIMMSIQLYNCRAWRGENCILMMIWSKFSFVQTLTQSF